MIFIHIESLKLVNMYFRINEVMDLFRWESLSSCPSLFKILICLYIQALQDSKSPVDFEEIFSSSHVNYKICTFEMDPIENV